MPAPQEKIGFNGPRSELNAPEVTVRVEGPGTTSFKFYS